MSLQLAVILVPVVFGMMGFALDLGRLYLVRGELNQAAAAAAIAAASQLIGTATSLDHAGTVATQTLALNKYNFGSLTLGQDTGNLTSTITDPAYFASVAGAIGTDPNGASADGTTARHVQISVTADAPLLFWSLLSAGASRKTPVAVQVLAGVSAPLCTACGIEPFAIAAKDASDLLNFGLGDPAADVHYTFYYNCTGTVPTFLPNSGQSAAYTIINRYDSANTTVTEETDQLFRLGAAGLMSSTAPNPTGSPVPLGCVGIGDALEAVWVSPTFSAVPPTCTSALPPVALAALCGLYSRFDNLTLPTACTTGVTNYTALSAAYLPDTDIVTGQGDIYSTYFGNGRRVITVPVVDALAPNTATPMVVLGFRQFLVQLAADGTFLNPSDANGRFVATYIGSPMPVKQGYIDDRFAQSCPAPVTSGPGKVVLHR
ncbi:MAG: pilus assembly protein TadG-related protein [Candidatus Solibacter sp.]|nr:pilus assembly protein TadG-related protein [Candidatus Solibacter sp.]